MADPSTLSRKQDEGLTPGERPVKRARTDELEEPIKVIVKPTTQTDVGEDDWEEPETEVIEETDNAGKKSDLYLDTVNRLTLDFDFEKVCSVSLSNINIYGCLVCGKYFQGRGKSTYAYAHSIHEDHHVFIHLETQKVYVLPDGYEVKDPSLEDIASFLAPTFTRAQIASLNSPAHLSQPSFDLSSKPYIPGYVGLNNIKKNDYLNVIIHALVHVPPLRDYLLLFGNTNPSSAVAPAKSVKTKVLPPSELLRRFSILAKKLWNPKLFKSQVSPHEFLQEVVRASAGKFQITEQGDPVEFLGWLLNKLHIDMGGTRKRGSSVIYSTFQGELRLETQEVAAKTDWEGNARTEFEIGQETKKKETPFLFLAVDLPPPPLFQDSVEKNIIPQVTLGSVLAKYDGVTAQESGGQLRRFKCQRLPPYIILHFKRFTKNYFVEEKNPTIVNFPLKGVDFADYVDTSEPISTVYDLIANVTHESTAGTARDKENTVWKVQLKAGSKSESKSPDVTSAGVDDEIWYQLQDLVVEEIQKEMIFLGEVVLQVWQRRDMKKSGSRDVTMKAA
ncbi:hypothetical protein FRC02_009389 [Tulasnella sp. 418]|nr:hypothetical protein FRC02_009389 [Tulasnella sp. 418]